MGSDAPWTHNQRDRNRISGGRFGASDYFRPSRKRGGYQNGSAVFVSLKNKEIMQKRVENEVLIVTIKTKTDLDSMVNEVDQIVQEDKDCIIDFQQSDIKPVAVSLQDLQVRLNSIGRSLVILTSYVDWVQHYETLNFVPTLQECFDLIAFDKMERELTV